MRATNGHMAFCIPAASAARAPRSELRLMKAIGRNVILALPLRTYSFTTWGIDVWDASLQTGHDVSPYSMISTGALAFPMVLPSDGISAYSFCTLSTFSMLDTD